MYVSLAHIRPKPGKVDQVIKLFSSMDEHISQVPGLIGLHVFRSENKDEPLALMAGWKDKASCDAHRRTFEANRELTAELHELCMPEHSETRFEQVHLVHGPEAKHGK
jgi:quinol monooxygenase YgiN